MTRLGRFVMAFLLALLGIIFIEEVTYQYHAAQRLSERTGLSVWHCYLELLR